MMERHRVMSKTRSKPNPDRSRQLVAARRQSQPNELPEFLAVALLVIIAAHQSLSSPSSSSVKIVGVTPVSVSGWIVVAFVTVVGAPIIEELFFRGLIQGAFTRRTGPVPAIFITALIFAVIHVTDEGVFAPIILFPLAVMLGYLKHRTGRLAAGMVAHATFNATLFAVFLIPAFR